ncbi:preprotein translocase subunit SecE [Phycicoccus elongatus]|uniref:Protein translocase subunit SecE n=1 Tax=Phycicoccus elongatus Lp2 TaxID=1193181 RepID=N0E5B5_9MICO|nr:preprotein translocase subunit SecE [Tetrasphaera sp.]MCB1238998.1 preprotein translocase subunit SecE [Tetrasphaera sp.]MCB9406116.1 preprotein translocase subunit SecE [Tetrasphaera sp.]CCH71216.1 Preprotein translocase subunit secE [Phycicoccus elongatus Lp2]
MTELGSPRDTGRTKKVAAKSGNPVSRFFASIGLFIRQILDELRKVVRPTRSELWNYTLVVIVFVTFMMAMVSGLDFGFSKLVGLVFGT